MKQKILLLLIMLMISASFAIAQNVWNQKSNFGGGQRQGTISFSIGDKGYIGAGIDEYENIRQDFWEYDPNTDTWTQRADYGGGVRYLATSFVVGSKGYAGTGIIASYNWREDMWEYDPATNTWNQKSDFPGGARYAATGFGIGNKGYMGTGNYRVGPADYATYYNDFYEYNPATDTWIKKADVPEVGRTNAIGMSIGNKGYIGTGFYYYDSRRNDLWEYDPLQDNWTRKADIPGPARYGASAFTILGKGYISGGWYFDPLNDLWQFDPAKNTWIQKQLFPGANRYDGTGFAIGNKGYFGLGGNASGSLADFWEYSPDIPAHPPHVQFDPAMVGTYAGSGIQGFVNGGAANAQFNRPRDLASDSAGNIYVADYLNHSVRKINPQGLVTTHAGNGLPGFANGEGVNAQFNEIAGITVGRFGLVFVADQGNHRIRRISPSGFVSNVAGTGVAGFADGYEFNAQFDRPSDVVTDQAGNIYVADLGNNRIRKIEWNGYVSTFAGNGTAGYEDGQGTDASFSSPIQLAIDKQGNIYVTEIAGPIRKITPQGLVSTFTVPGMFGFFGSIVFDPIGNLYISLSQDADRNRINKVSPDGDLTFVAGSTSGFVEGYGDQAKFAGTSGLAFDRLGNLIVADYSNDRIRKVFAPPHHFITNPGQSSVALPVRVSGLLLTGNVVITASPGFEVSSSMNGSFSNQLTIPAPYEKLPATDIYVRMTAVTNPGNKFGKLVLSSAGAVSKELSVSGHITMPIVRFDHNVVTTLAGGLTAGMLNGNGAASMFNQPMDVATDAAGNSWVADFSNNSIRKISPQGHVTTFAGDGTPGLVDGAGQTARFDHPSGVAIDKLGNIYVADYGNNSIRKISPLGNVTTIAGNSGPVNAGFNRPQDIAVDDAGFVYVADHYNHRIRKVSPSGEVSNFAGNGTTGTADGTGSEAQFYYPQRLNFDANGNLFVTEVYGPLRRITPDGKVTSIISDALYGFHDGVALDEASNIYVSLVLDGNYNYVTKHANNGADALVAGSTRGYFDSTGAGAKFDFVGGISLDGSGNIYVADMNNNCIRKIGLPQLYFSTHVGLPSFPQSVSFSGSDLTGDALLTAPPGFELASLPQGPYSTTVIVSPNSGEIVSHNIYVRLNGGSVNAIYKGHITVSSTGSISHTIEVFGTVYAPIVQFDPSTVTTLAGSGETGFMDGAATQAKFNSPKGVALDYAGNYYVADAGNNRIRKILPSGVVSTFAGNGDAGLADGNGENARFSSPSGIAVDLQGNVYVADAGNHAIRKITPDGTVTTMAGNGEQGFIDGQDTAARFNDPVGLTVDVNGNIYVADNSNHSIRKILPSGVVITIAGNGTPGSVDGSTYNSQFLFPNNITIDKEGNLYVTQWYAPLRKISVNGNVTTLLTPGLDHDLFQDGVAIDAIGNIILSVIQGNGQNAIYKLSPTGIGSVIAAGSFGYEDGSTDSARFYDPAGIAISPLGEIFIADAGNNRIRRIFNAPVELITQGSNASQPKSFLISGAKLSGATELQAPEKFEVSLNENGVYSNSILIEPVDDIIFSLRAYVRMAAGNFTGEAEGALLLSAAGAITQTLTVRGSRVDTMPPVIVCPPALILCYNNTHTYSVPLLAASDASGISSIVYSISGATTRSGSGPNASGFFNSGRNVIAWTVTDSVGNVGTCQTVVTVDRLLTATIPDAYPLLIWGNVNTLYLGFGPSCTRLSVFATGGTRFSGNKYRYVWSNGATTSSINVCPSVTGSHNYSVRIIDSLGCEVTVSKTIHVVDVRCGPAFNKVLVCWSSKRGNQQACLSPGQATLALLFGAKLGACNSTPLTTAKPQSGTVRPAENEAMSAQIIVYPNPNKGVFTVQLSGITASELRVVDVNGKLILIHKINNSVAVKSVSLNLGNTASGYYFVQAIGKNGMISYKVFVQR